MLSNSGDLALVISGASIAIRANPSVAKIAMARRPPHLPKPGAAGPSASAASAGEEAADGGDVAVHDREAALLPADEGEADRLVDGSQASSGSDEQDDSHRSAEPMPYYLFLSSDNGYIHCLFESCDGSMM